MTTTAAGIERFGSIDGVEGVEIAQANGINIAYETFGKASDPTILLVMGLAAQMIAWNDEMCATLASAGLHVVRFDNRDIGLSTHIGGPAPTRKDLLLRKSAPYSVGDMAEDARGLLDALDIETAHVVGVSMGGFISQTLTLAHPERVRSLTLVMTSTGSRRVGHPTPRVLRHMATRVLAKTKDAAVTESLATARMVGTPSHFDEVAITELTERSFERSWDPEGVQRQIAAIMSQPNRTSDLSSITSPTVVIHGLRDHLVSHSGGLALAKAIPEARFVGQHGFGHDLPRTFWPGLVDETIKVVARSEP